MAGDNGGEQNERESLGANPNQEQASHENNPALPRHDRANQDQEDQRGLLNQANEQAPKEKGWVKMCLLKTCCLVVLIGAFFVAGFFVERHLQKSANSALTSSNFTPTPLPPVTCRCDAPNQGTAPYNNFTCSDGYTSWCAANGTCTATQPWSKGDGPTDCRQVPAPTSSSPTSLPTSSSPTSHPTSSVPVTCHCQGTGNHFICSDGSDTSCEAGDACVATQSWTKGDDTVFCRREITGYYSLTWNNGSFGFQNATIGIAYTGSTTIDHATIHSYTGPALNSMSRFISFGSANSAGAMTPKVVQTIANSTEDIKQAGYNGVMFECGQIKGSTHDIVSAFNSTITKLKEAGLSVAVTMTFSGPTVTSYIDTGGALVKLWLNHPHLDIISPQMYKYRTEKSPKFTETTCPDKGCAWERYQKSKPLLVPSIVSSDQYDEMKDGFRIRQLTVQGYFQWNQQ